LNRFRKALSVGVSAALLASLFTMTAGSALAATYTGFTVTGVGSIATDGTTGAISIAVAEDGIDGWATGLNTIEFTIEDAQGNGTGTVDWRGTPVVTGAPGSLTDIAVSRSLNVLTVTFDNSNNTQAENFTLSGMTIKTVGAAVGAIRLVAVATAGVPGGIAMGTGTASGVLLNDEAVGSTALEITCDTGSFEFAVTDANNGNLAIAAPDAESRGITAAGTCAASSATVPALTSFHAADTVVTQSVGVAGLLTAPATVVATLYTNVEDSPQTVLPGEQNQTMDVGFELGEPIAGTLKVGTVVTFKIDTAGVTFSSAPGLEIGGDIVLVDGLVCPLSFDRTSCSVTVKTKSTVADDFEQIELEEDDWSLDVAASVPLGTKISINVTTSQAGLPVVVNPDGDSTDNVVAVVGRVIVGVAASPTIFINFNDQSTGMITLIESGPGFFPDASFENQFELCLTSGESFTRAPWAVVTVGDLKLRSGVVGASSVQGTLTSVGSNNCVQWVVYTKSTVASTIEIRGSDASNVVLPSGPLNGPRLSVPSTLTPGPVAIDIYTTGPDNWLLTGKVSNAVRAYKSDVIVMAVSQPTILAGSVAARAGNITISETLAGQFKPGEVICVAIEPRSSNDYNQDTYFNTSSNNMLPIITTNSASGLIVGAVMPNSTSCDNYSDTRSAFQFPIVQQAFGPTTGVITISNINVNVNADAPNGAVIVHVFKDNCECSGVDFGAFVSNARIGSAAAADAWIAKGLSVRAASAFGLATAATTRGSYVTIRAKIAGAAGGTLVGIWVKTATTAWRLETSRRVSTDGYVYYSGKVLNLGYRYYRAAAFGGLSNTVRAFGR
jgi:hypothetical protein